MRFAKSRPHLLQCHSGPLPDCNSRRPDYCYTYESSREKGAANLDDGTGPGISDNRASGAVRTRDAPRYRGFFTPLPSQQNANRGSGTSDAVKNHAGRDRSLKRVGRAIPLARSVHQSQYSRPKQNKKCDDLCDYSLDEGLPGIRNDSCVPEGW